ncbi:outer membrane lipoprotein carrier protein LolA, partial [Methylobacterium isbiliense]|nr:outer membrane lipoprotein carrier protein LolA [Methylobacterium isbiliense]
MTGRRTRPGPLPVLAAALCVAGALAAPPAQAQVTSFLDGLFGRKDPAPAPAPAPEPAPAGAPAGAGSGSGVRAPLPPRRPAALGGT